MHRYKKYPQGLKVFLAVLFVFQFFITLHPAYALSLSRKPYLQAGTSTGIVIRWRTDIATDSKVRYGKGPNSLDKSVYNSDQAIDHEITLTGLTPSTKYFYSVGNADTALAGGDQHYFITYPACTEKELVRIWAIGDSGAKNGEVEEVRDAYYRYTGETGTDLILGLGDEAYGRGTDKEFQKNFFNIFDSILTKSVYWATFSNHSARSADSDTQSGPYYDNFTFPKKAEGGGIASGTEAYYSFNFGNIHFISLDSQDTDKSVKGEMLSWLKKDLANATQKWIIAFWHHPPYSFGSHNSDTEWSLVKMRERAVPILDGGGVDLVLSGHSHIYERSMLINGHYGKSSTFKESMAVNSGDGKRDGDGPYVKADRGKGTVYIVAGSGTRLSSANAHPVMAATIKKHGSVVIDIKGGTMDVKFLTSEGAVADYFTIQKTSD